MARAGLGKTWNCLFANDFDQKKSATYRANWGEGELQTADVRSFSTSDLPGYAELVWASFPCQDLSLAGGGAGLKGERSGTFWPFWSLIKQLKEEGRAPKAIVLENVCGTLTSHKGQDFVAICNSLSEANYNFGAIVVDAALFLPQSRPRLFFVAIEKSFFSNTELQEKKAVKTWHTNTLIRAQNSLSPETKNNWVWWNMPTPPTRDSRFSDLIEEKPSSVSWHTREETKQLLSMMSEIHIQKVKEAQKSGKKMVGAIYKRTRKDEEGRKVQRAEVRFDDVAGCLRTPAGGSSRQLIMVVEGNKIRSRLISSRETARLMGLPDDYKLPESYNEAYHLTGDGVAVPVVDYIARNLLDPIFSKSRKNREAA